MFRECLKKYVEDLNFIRLHGITVIYEKCNDVSGLAKQHEEMGWES